MSGLPFFKYQSIGNDFILVEEQSVQDADLSELARSVCDRKFGAGSDGLLLIGTDSEQSRITMRMFNPDGSEDFCGNGLRCAALHTRLNSKDRDRAYGGERLSILHGGFENQITFSPGGWIDVGLPRHSFSPELVPLAQGVGEVFDTSLVIADSNLRVCSLTTGSTHTVVLRDGPPTDEEFFRVSPVLEKFDWFPKRTSVIWCWPLEAKTVGIRIWERGVGETLGCGTGSAAAAACWFRRNPGIVALAVMNPGGEAVVSKGAGGGLVVSARASGVYTGRLVGPVRRS